MRNGGVTECEGRRVVSWLGGKAGGMAECEALCGVACQCDGIAGGM